MTAGIIKLEDISCKLLLIHLYVLMFEFSFHSRVQNQKLIIYLMFCFFFLWFWGGYMYREMTMLGVL